MPIHAFTIGVSDNHPDVVYAWLAAKRFGARHHILIPSQRQLEKAAHARKEKPEIFAGDGDGNVGGFGPFFLLQSVADYAKRLKLCEPRLIVHDGIDELLGGYWEHRRKQSAQKQRDVFIKMWGRLESFHLSPLKKKADYFDVEPLFPYLQSSVIEYISRIPLHQRTSHEESKIPLRKIAMSYLPRAIILRQKVGFCDALKKFE